MAPVAHNVRIVEVGPRDGLQNLKAYVPTEIKVELITRLAQTGLLNIELTSHVNPKAVPQLKDAICVIKNKKIQNLLTGQRVRLPVLVPGISRLKDLKDVGVAEVAVFISATDGFSKANIRCTAEEGLQNAIKTTSEARKAGLLVRGYVSCIFADPFDGPTAPNAVLRSVKKLLEAGCYEVSLGDTLGVGMAKDVSSLLAFLKNNDIPLAQLAGHFHDTYGQGVSNVWAAYTHGLRTFDASVAGLGGCPFAPGATGNVSTEDIVYLFHQAGVSTGVDLKQLAKVGSWICDRIAVASSSRSGTAILNKDKGNLNTKSPPSNTPQISWKLQRKSFSDDIRMFRAGPDMKIELNSPRNGNALTLDMTSSLCKLLQATASDPTILRIIITGSGRFFCTGMDISHSGVGGGPDENKRELQHKALAKLFDLLDSAPQVTIACINGPCYGGGIGLAFACNIRLASPNVTFTLSEVRLGLCPAVISKYVIREWGYALSRTAMLRSTPVTADQLHRLGAIADLSSNARSLTALSNEYLHSLRGCAPGASAQCKKLVQLGWKCAGSEEQEKEVQVLFDNMLKPGSEGVFGMKEFQRGNKNIDWSKVVIAKQKL